MADLVKTISSLDPKDIQFGERLRPIKPSGVESLRASFAVVGVIKDAIHVRQKKDGFWLIAGGHRLTFALEEGWDAIDAKVWRCTDDWARMLEIDDNIAGSSLDILDTAVFLSRRKVVFERLFPETKSDAFHGNQHTQGLAADIVSFATATADKFGISERHVRRMVAAGSQLKPEEIDQLRKAPKPVTLADLTEISKIGDHNVRSQVVMDLVGGSAKSAKDARKKISAQPGDAAMSDADKKLRALLDAFARAPRTARKHFVSENAETLRELLGDADEEPAEVIQFVRAGDRT